MEVPDTGLTEIINLLSASAQKEVKSHLDIALI